MERVGKSGTHYDPFPAHIRVLSGNKDYQTVHEHCENTANYVSERLTSTGLASLGYLIGYLHDMGKYTDTFKSYIERSANGEAVVRGSVNHTFCGVIYIMERYHLMKVQSISTLTAEIIAFAIGSHHGEFDCVNLDGESGFEYRLSKDRNEIHYDEAVKNYLQCCVDEEEIDRLFSLASAEVEALFSQIKVEYKSKTPVWFLVGMTARLVLSALIDSDRLDTFEYMSGNTLSLIKTDKALWMNHLHNLENQISAFNSTSPINNARRYFSDTCRDFGERISCGIFRLTLPTGAGKTLSSLRYALANAARFSKKRIVFVIPLLSILEQNGEVIRKYIGDDRIVTEHHSNFVKDFDTDDELNMYELVTQTWESPVLVTTLVQLLNTLFSGKSSAIRRMNALVDSVIVIDEVQSLPKKVTYMFNLAINFLAQFCGATIVLSSATMPEFNTTDVPLKFSEPKDIVPYNKKTFDVFKRTEIVDSTITYGMTLEELADFSAQTFDLVSSLLVICNTKKSAEQLYTELKLRNKEVAIYHLSASMCMKHRSDILEQIKSCLNTGKRVMCVSTQIVEAGVDFSFQSVIRVLAGVDNIAQAAGRCNRNNDFPGTCKVHVVNLKVGSENLKMLNEIAATQRCTASLFAKFKEDPSLFDNDLISDKSIVEYYTSLFSDDDIKASFDYPVKAPRGNLVKLFRLLADNSEMRERPSFKGSYFLNQSFKSAGMLFEVFDEKTTDVIVPYNEEAREIIADLNTEKARHDISFLKNTVERAKPYVIRLFEYQKKRLSEDGMLHSDINGYFIFLNELCYNNETGLKIGDIFL